MTDVLTHPAAVRASVNYAVDTGGKRETGGADGLVRTYRAAFEPHLVTITNGRPRRGDYRLHQAGFQLADHPTAMTDVFDPEALARVGYPEAAALIAQVSGAARVHVYPALGFGGCPRPAQDPRAGAHGAQPEWSGGPVRQVWRAIDAPIARDPLAPEQGGLRLYRLKAESCSGM